MRRLRPAPLALLLALAAACADDPVVVADREPPAATVLTDADRPDFDGDGLVDVRVRWTTGDVDLATVRVTGLDGVGGAPPGTVDLLDAWQVLVLDGTGLHLEETIDALLRAGPSRIALAAADTVGNEWTDTLVLDLPAMELHREIDLGTGFPNNADYCKDDRLYVNLFVAIVVLDGRTLEEVARVPFDGEVDNVACVPGQPWLAFTGTKAGVVDRRSLEPTLSPVSGSVGLAWTAMDPDHFYAGSNSTAGSSVYVYRLPTAGFDELIRVDERYGTVLIDELAISDVSRRIYVPRGPYGIVEVDFDTREVIDTLHVAGGTFTSYGLAMSPDRSVLYAAVTYGVPHGLGILPVDAAGPIPVVETPGNPIELDVSPSGARVFLTTNGDFDYLLAVPSGQVLATLPRVRDPNDYRVDGAVTFNRTGTLLFNAYALESSRVGRLQVYLNRE